MSDPAPGPRLRDLEAVLFVADEPLSAATLAQLLDIGRPEAEGLLGQLAAEYEQRLSGIALRRVAGGWRLSTDPRSAPVVERFVLSSRHTRMTKAALETMAIVAYKQPVTRHQVSSIRGVDSDGVLRALVDRGLLAEVGRDDGPGRPVLYGTTGEFLERLGLDSVGDLPPLAPLLGEDGGDGAAARAGEDVAETHPGEEGV
jgi:segregation and condensation protein B